ncbi:hypothetical protein GCM10028825_15410 [Spirosoma agri]
MGSVGVAIPVILFLAVWSYYAVNVPKWDDHALRAFLYSFDQEKTISGKVYQLFKQHNEHRIVLDRFVALLDFKVLGKLDYRHLMAVGNLSLVGLLLVFISVLRREGRSIAYAIPPALLIFNLSHWENMFWGMAALQNFSVVLWVVLSIYWLTYENRWRWAIVTAILATLTSGNGLIVWPIGLALILLNANNSSSVESAKATKQSRILPVAGWFVSAILVLGLYFADYAKPEGNPPLRGSAVDLLKGWLAFIGAAAEALPVKSALPACIALGGLLVVSTLGLMGWQLVINRLAVSRALRGLVNPRMAGSGKGIPTSTLFFWGCAAFVLGTAAVVAWTRTGFGLDLIITSRYKIYSLTLLALLYLSVATAVNKPAGRWVMIGGLAGSFLFAWFAYFTFLDDSIWFRHWQTTNQFNWTYTQQEPTAEIDSLTLHYTDPAPAFYDSILPALYGPAEKSLIPVTVAKAPYGYMVQTGASAMASLSVDQSFGRDAGTYLLARSPERSYLFPVWQNQRTPRQARFWPGNIFTTGFKADIWQSALKAGTYQLFVVTISAGNQCTVYPTSQLITSAGQPKDIKKNW